MVKKRMFKMKKENNKELLRKIPSISKFIESPQGKKLCRKYGDGFTKYTIKKQLDKLRSGILDGKLQEVPSLKELSATVEKEVLRMTTPEGRKAVNATGILLHTALGRAPYADNARDALSIFNGYLILQVGLEDGKRCKRDGNIEGMLCELTGCEAATVVNNNAEATMLVLNTLSKSKEAVISRGQLVEIGGSFRIPDVMKQSGAKMHEIGTTNRTHLKDYTSAVNDKTGAIVHVHTSNYRVRGFSGTPDIKEICELRKKEFPDIPVVDDVGSGALVPLSEFGLSDEPLVKDSIQAGTDIACFSGDKLISGSQCGIICGKKELVEKIRKNAFARMFRVDKMTLAVLESTLIHFINGTYRKNIPFYRMLGETLTVLEKRAKKIGKSLKGISGIKTEVIDGAACVGSGSIPDEDIPDKVLKVSFNDESVKLEKIACELRNNIPSIFARISDNSLQFSMRTLLPGDDEILTKALPELF